MSVPANDLPSLPEGWDWYDDGEDSLLALRKENGIGHAGLHKRGSISMMGVPVDVAMIFMKAVEVVHK